MKTKDINASTWDNTQMDSDRLLDDNLMKTIFLFPEKISSRGTANSGKPIRGTTRVNTQQISNRNSRKG